MRDPHLIKWLDSFTKPTTGPFGEGDKGYHDANGLQMTNNNDDDDDGPSPSESFKSSSSSVSVENDKRLSSRLLTYHGIAGLNSTLFPTWDTYFKKLLEEPSTSFVVESNNRLVREFTVDIEPGRLCSRILSVREQIAGEWVRDLDVVIDRGGCIRSAVREKLGRGRGESTTDDDSTEGMDNQYKGGGNNWIRVPPRSSSGDTDAVFERMNLSFLEEDAGSELASSPLRKGNFDLLTLLTTKESIRRVLDNDDGTSCTTTTTTLTPVSLDFLRTFYQERAESFFGCKTKRYHLADEFIAQLVTEPARMVTLGDSPVFVDPVGIAEVVLAERERVANEWKEEVGAASVDHAEIRRLQLDRMVGL